MIFTAALARVARNGSLLRVELGWLAAMTADGAYLVSLLIYAYEAGGVVAVGLVTTLRALPAALLAPLLSAFADRFPRARVLLGIHLVRAAAVAAVAAAAIADLPLAVALVPIVAEGLLLGVHRATTLSLMPALARSPEELVAANAVMTLSEGAGALIGPVVAGLLLAVSQPAVGLGAAAGAYLCAALAVLSIEVVTVRRRVAAPGSEPMTSRAGEMLGGVRALRRHPSAGLVVALFGAQTLVRGSLTVLVVATAVELLGIGRSGVGYLTSAIGAGGFTGAMLAMALVGGGRLSKPFATSLALWGIPIVVLGLLPLPVVAFAMLGVVGAANASLDVAGFTLLQRTVPNAVRGRVFGALEGVAALGLAAGAAAAPLLVELFGLQAALVATGAVLPILAVAAYRRLRHADDAAIVPHRELALLRQIPMFAPLPLTVVEHLASSLVPVRYDAGGQVIRQGDVGDSFYVVATGSVEVIHDGRHVATLSSGDGFGEIALLGDRPRTASVVAREPMEAFRLPRDAFLEGVTGSTHSVAAADQLMTSRLAELGH